MRLAMVALAAILSACATPVTPEQYVAALGRQCASYGFEAGSQEWKHCRMQLDMQIQSQQEQARQSAAQAFVRKPSSCRTFNGTTQCF